MTEGGKKALKQTGDHNWDLERMQFEKDKGNISNEQDYVNKQTKQRDIQAALNRVRTIKRESTQIEKNLNYLLPIQLMTFQSFLLEVKIYQSFQSGISSLSKDAEYSYKVLDSAQNPCGFGGTQNDTIIPRVRWD